MDLTKRCCICAPLHAQAAEARKAQKQDAERVSTLQRELEGAREALRESEGVIQRTDVGSPHELTQLHEQVLELSLPITFSCHAL